MDSFAEGDLHEPAQLRLDRAGARHRSDRGEPPAHYAALGVKRDVCCRTAARLAIDLELEAPVPALVLSFITRIDDAEKELRARLGRA